ncbi:CoA transferase subunit A [Streptomyces sp. SBT349]|uniref:CoA transferase subunit A n=1 Tax=Streptomyces sp. SBT349 TaxID=1580539 RepID=UPI00066AB574|nr:3-oxoacid CoA-transferase subunit A [Streptomyces sp. SBT349]
MAKRTESPGGVPDKTVSDPAAAVAGVRDGAVVLVGGWGGIGVPEELIGAVAASGVTDLVLASNNCGMGRPGDVGQLFRNGQVRRAIATFPAHPAATDFRTRFENGEVELELIPQGTLAERLRAAGAGLGGFFTPTGAGTRLTAGRETRVIDGLPHILEPPLRGDMALIKADQADGLGNLRFRYAARGLNPIMAMAARTTVVQADELVPVGGIHPDDVHLPGIFVDRVLVTGGGR